MLSVTASVVFHAGLAACFLIYTPAMSVTGRPAGASLSGDAMTVSLTRSSPASPAPAGQAFGPMIATDLASPSSHADGSGSADATAAETGQGQAGVSAVGVSASDGRAAAPAPQAGADASAAGSDYQRRLLAHIEPFRRYPDDAGQDGVRGVVELAFQIDRVGGVSNVWIAKSSGSASLDAAAVATVRRAAPLPPIPSELPDTLIVQLPVAFSAPG